MYVSRNAMAAVKKSSEIIFRALAVEEGAAICTAQGSTG